MTSKELLGLDIGDIRVGLALATEEGRLAKAFDTYSRKDGQAEKKIIDLLKDRGISSIIAGMPLSEDNQTNEQCSRVLNFCRRLRRRVNVTIVFVDEYLSSLEAKDLLGLSPEQERLARKKGSIDAVSAALILQAYLDGEKHWFYQEEES